MKRFLITWAGPSKVLAIVEFDTTKEVSEAAIEAKKAAPKLEHSWSKAESIEALAEMNLFVKIYLLERQIEYLKQFVDDSLLTPTEETEDMACGGKKGGKKPKK